MMKICILLSTYNGEKYIQEQMDSLLIQNADILVRDDGSTDETLNILNSYQQIYPKRIQIINSQRNLGIANSFITLLSYAVKQGYDYFFFSDQDDVWLPEKCSRAVKKLEENSAQLYFSRKKIVDSNLTPLGIEDYIDYHGYFWDCFNYSNISGCTLCIHKSLAEKVILNNFENKRYLHDAFIYRLAIVLDVGIVFDDYESILYRQHSGNIVGAINRKRFRDKLSKDAIKNRKHYMQNIMKDIFDSYQIPNKNAEIMRLILNYNTLKKKKEFLRKIITSNASIKLKANLIYKILFDIL